MSSVNSEYFHQFFLFSPTLTKGRQSWLHEYSSFTTITIEKCHHRGRRNVHHGHSGRAYVGSSELIVSKIDGPLLNLLIDEQDDANPPLHRYYCAMMAPFRHFAGRYVRTRTKSLQRCSTFKISIVIKNREILYWIKYQLK